MTLVIPPGFSLCSIPIKHNALNRSATVTFGLETGGSGDSFPVQADEVMADWNTHLAPRLDSGCTAGPVELTVGQDGGTSFVEVGTTTSAGTRAGVSTPPNVAVLVTKRSSQGGRRGRGRMFFPWFILASEVDEVGVMAPAIVTAIQTPMTAFLAALVTDLHAMHILHNTGDSPTGSPTLVSTLRVESLIATQRRRLGR